MNNLYLLQAKLKEKPSISTRTDQAQVQHQG